MKSITRSCHWHKSVQKIKKYGKCQGKKPKASTLLFPCLIRYMLSSTAHLEFQNKSIREKGFASVGYPYRLHLSIHPSVQACNLCFRVCVMCLRTTTESRGGNRLALCCSPTLTWYDSALSLCVFVYVCTAMVTANYTGHPNSTVIVIRNIE